MILTRTVDAQTDAMYPDVMELIQFDGIGDSVVGSNEMVIAINFAVKI